MDTMKHKYGIAQRPENERRFTTEDVIKALGVSRAFIFNTCTKYGIIYETQLEGNTKRAYFSYENMQEIKHYIGRAKHKSELELQAEESEDAHPLVTDKRCLNLNYWPDSVPACFKGGEND